MANHSIHDLFKQIAPDYNDAAITSHLREKFSSLSEDAFTVQVSEFLKFMYLRSKYGTGFIPLTSAVDDIWHAFILQTKEYETFCYSLPGKHFVHHNSISLENYAAQNDRDSIVRNLILWLPNYVKHFGPFNETTGQYWSMVNFLMTECHLSLNEINQLSANHTSVT